MKVILYSPSPVVVLAENLRRDHPLFVRVVRLSAHGRLPQRSGGRALLDDPCCSWSPLGRTVCVPKRCRALGLQQRVSKLMLEARFACAKDC